MGSPNDHESTPEPIAVVGMACRFPDAGDPRAFWANLIAGKVSTGEVPIERWDWRAHRGGAGPEGDAVGGKWGSFIEGVDRFDAEFFGVSPKEAELMDPQQRVMLEVCWSCLEHAGVTPAGLPGRNVGVYIAVFNHDYKEILEREPRTILAHHATGCSASIVANRVSHYFDFSGPSLTIDTACSGSLYALHQAVLAMRSGECDAALAGGVNLLLTPTRHMSFGQTGMLSPTGRCHSFDERADGYVRGEGAGVVLLMPLGKALRGGHRIHGVIKGSAVNHGGKAFTLTYPSRRAQSDVIYRAWSGAGLNGNDIDYIEAHGTGTPKGDPIEWEGLNDACERLSGPGQPRAPRRLRALGTVKASIGHLEAAAGIAGLIKVLLAFEHARLPGLPGFSRLNPRLDAAASSFFPLTEATDWPPPLDDDGRRRPRRAGVSSFGFGGTNAHVVVEEFVVDRRAGDGPPSAPPAAVRRPALVVLSARREEQLRAAARNLLDYLHGDTNHVAGRLDRIAYTLQVGRVAMRERLAIAATSEHELAEKLQAFLAGRGGVEGLFRGKSKLESGTSNLPDAADELVARGAYEALLERWVQGAEVDWERFVEGERPATIALPTYPFARERYWANGNQLAAPPRDETKRQAILLLRPEWQAHGAPEAAGLPRSVRHCVALCDPSEALRGAVEAGLPEASVVALRSAGGSVEERFPSCAEELLRIVKKLLSATPKGPIFLQLVVSPGEVGAFYPALAGLLKSVNRENPNFLWQLVELDADAQTHAPARLLRQNSAALRDRHVRYEGGRRHVAAWAELASASGEAPWRRGGVYLITGGAGGLGQIFARDILRRSGGAQVVLVGRRALRAGDAEPLDRLQREAAALSHASVQYRAVDVTDRAAVASLIEYIQNELGPLHGIIHGAGVRRDNFVRKKSPAELREVLAPKVTGLVNLDAATKYQPLEIFALFSSVVGRVGNVGQADYAAANAFLGCYARYRNQQVADGNRRGHTVSIDWPLWQDGGMKIAAGAVTTLDQSAMPTEAGLEAFYGAVASGQAEVMVLAGDRDAQRRWLDALQTPPELESDRGEIAPPPPELHPKVLHRLRQILSKVSHLAFERIDAEEPLESYGIDSVLIAQLNAELECVVPGLSKTLFFEYQTLNAVAGHIVEAHPQASAAWTGLDGVGPRAEPAAAAPAPTSRVAAPTATPLAAPSTSTATPSAPPTPRPADPGEPIAVIGISGRYPGAPTLAALWHNLQAGKDCIGEIPAERWPLDGFFVADRRAALAQGKSYSKWGGFLEGFANFDPLFFNISPREARDTDPQERLFLETCWATVEDAGYTRAELQERYQGRVGVFVGITKTGFDLYGPELWRRGELQNPQTSFSSVANRVSYALNWQGPSMAIDTMCSASLTAIHEACEHIRRGECDLAIAGGVNLYLHPSSYVRLCAQQMLSADGHCKSFGEGGDGFVPGEGVGAILLKPLSLALRDGDEIRALILGTSVNHGGKTNGYTVPNPAAQARLVRQAMARAGVSARQVSYLEAHGTGTKLGDPIEVRGLQQAFEADTVDKQFCAIGSIKSNIGHLEAAAGIAGVTKVLLQMRHRTLVPSLHAETLNANIDFDQTPFFVQRELGEWPRPATLPGGDPPQPSRIAGVSSFGAGGSNGHVLLADYESAPPDDGAEGPHAIVLSAKDGDRLKAMAGNLARHLRDHRDTLGWRLRDVAYTLQIGRDAMDERLAFVATSYADAEKTLQRFVDGEAQIEGVCLGRVKANGDFLAIFDDEDAADVVERWLAKRKYGRLLELWVKGLDVDWKKLYRDVRPRRLSLPTYPFAGATYWLATDQVRPAAEPSLRSLHPLAQVNTSTFAGQSFRALLSGQEFFLSEHRVHGKGVLPGVAYLEMARAAVALSGPARVAGLRNVLWSSMLTVERPTTVTIDLSKDGDRVTFVVKTAASAEPHAQGSVVLEATPPGADVPAAPVVDVGEIEARCPVTIRDEQIYAHFQRLGLDYGPGFRALRDIKRGQGELLARYRLPASVASSEFALHPSVMDAALQASIGFAMHTDPAAPAPAPADPLLPFSVHAVDLLGAVSPAGYVHVVRVGASSASDVLAYDIRILNDNFVPCVALRRLTLRPLVRDDRRPAPRPRPPSPPARLLFATPRWREQPPPPDGGERPNALVLLVGGDAETAGRLATRLGGPVEVLAVDDELPIEEAAVEVVKQAFAKIKAALARALGAVGARAVRAVYVLASSERDARVRGPLAALLATVQQENGNARGRLIALSDRQLASADVLYDVVQREGAGDPAYHEIVYRPDGARLVKQWDEADLTAPPAARGGNAAPGASPAWVKDRGVYWITGGLGGLGRLFSEHLASVASGPISLVLSGRTALTDEGRRYLQSLERPGVAIEYRPCDVGDDDQVQAAADYIGRRYGRLDGVIHGAGVLRDGLMAGKDASDFEPVFAAKAKGAELIDRATESLNPEVFVLCSSVAAVTGNVGQAEYASANAYLDAFAEARDARRRARGRRGVTVSINWPLWRDGGMRVDAETEARLTRRTGLSALPTVEGLAALDAILARGVSGQVLVLSGDVDMMRRALSIGTRPAGEPPQAPSAALSVEQSLLEICAELLEIEQREFDLDTQLSEYGVDSIQMMRMLNRLEESYQITLDPSAIANHPTIRQLARYLVDEGAGGAGAAPASSRGGEARPTVGDASSPVAPSGEARASAPAARAPLVRPASQGRTGKIAIISQAGRFPRSPDLETFWLNLAAGKSLITEVPGDRWDVDSVYSADRSASDKSYSRHGGFLDDIAEFDAAFFGVNDDEALSLDPQHRIVLELARELFARAGYGREKLDGSRTAVLLGAKDNNYLRNHYGSFEPASLKNMIANSIANMMAARVSDFYNLKGAAKTVDTACSSSLVAVHDACQSIRTGEADLAVAGGIFLLVDPFYHVGFSRAEVLSDDGRMYVFDERAKGFVLGEGAGLVLLKDYDDAQRDGDRILGVVLASAVNNDGRTMGITVPSADGQKAVIEEALGRSGVSPEAIGYLEAHGTGTLLGDPIEVKAATDVYRKYTSATGYCALGSVKSNMGHSLTAAGIASLIKVLLGLQHGQIPATIHCTRPHPRFRFDASPFYPNTTLREWKPLGDRRVAAVTSLGFGGTNCHLIVADR